MSHHEQYSLRERVNQRVRFNQWWRDEIAFPKRWDAALSRHTIDRALTQQAEVMRNPAGRVAHGLTPVSHALDRVIAGLK